MIRPRLTRSRDKVIAGGRDYIFSINIIAISDDNVYVAGYTGTEGTPGYAAYWKNGEVNLLTDGSFFACAKSIRVYGEDGYVTCPDVQVAKYWKNGTEVLMPETELCSTVSSVAVLNGDVYAAGLIGGSNSAEGKVTYWKNNELQIVQLRFSVLKLVL
jgi:hypothetical protein